MNIKNEPELAVEFLIELNYHKVFTFLEMVNRIEVING